MGQADGEITTCGTIGRNMASWQHDGHPRPHGLWQGSAAFLSNTFDNSYKVIMFQSVTNLYTMCL